MGPYKKFFIFALLIYLVNLIANLKINFFVILLIALVLVILIETYKKFVIEPRERERRRKRLSLQHTIYIPKENVTKDALLKNLKLDEPFKWNEEILTKLKKLRASENEHANYKFALPNQISEGHFDVADLLDGNWHHFYAKQNLPCTIELIEMTPHYKYAVKLGGETLLWMSPFDSTKFFELTKAEKIPADLCVTKGPFLTYEKVRYAISYDPDADFRKIFIHNDPFSLDISFNWLVAPNNEVHKFSIVNETIKLY